jgi:PAS domain S-box-containing protein
LQHLNTTEDTATFGGISRFETLAEASPAIIFVHQDGMFQYVNPAAETVLGYARDELLHMHFWELIHPDHRDLVRTRGAMRQSGQAVPPRYDFKIITKDGRYRTLDCTASRYELKGRPAVLGIAFDITDRKRAQQVLAAQLAVSQALAGANLPAETLTRILRGVCEAMDWDVGVLWRADGEANVLRCVDVYGRPGAAVQAFAEHIRSLVLPPGLGLPGRIWSSNETACASAITEDHRFQAAGPAAGSRLCGALAFPVRVHGVVEEVMEFFFDQALDEDVELTRVFAAIGTQIGQFLERNRASESSRRSEERFRLLFEWAPVPIALHRGDGRYLRTNGAYQRMVGYSNEELLSLGVRKITHPEDVAEGQRLVQELVDRKLDRYQREKRFLHKNGAVVWVRSTAGAVRNAEGEFDYIISIVEDITERKRGEGRAAAFSNLAYNLSAASSAPEAARIIGSVASSLFGWDAYYLHLFSPEGLILPVLTVDTINGERTEVPRGTFTLDPSPMMIEVTARGPRLINRESLELDPGSILVRFGDKNRPSASLMYVPIRSGAKTVGIMSVQSYTLHAYAENDLAILQSLADHCAGTLERIHSAERLRRSESRLRALVGAVPDLMLRLSRDGTIIDAKININRADAASAPFEKSTSGKLQEVWPEPITQLILEHVQKALLESEPQIFEFEFPTPQGARDYEARLVCSSPDEVLAIIRDFTERKQLENEVLLISAREQQRIGKDLHDGLGQLLTGLAFFARSLQEKLGAKSLEESADAAHLTQLALKATTQARLMARGLYPVELETRGLAAALTELAHSIEKLHSISCSVELDASLPPFRKSQDKHLFRIVQEAANNAVKHSQCRQITIALKAEGPSAVLAIRDDGHGIGRRVARADGMGLRIMRYRARRIGAQLGIHPATGGGTEVLLRIPGRKRKPPDQAAS